MNGSNGSRGRVAATAALFLVAGSALGILADRALFSPRPLEATALTPAAMAKRLHLSPGDEARLDSLLDTFHADMIAALPLGPDSIRATVHQARRRIEAILPVEVRSEFHAWMREHHRRMRRLHSDRLILVSGTAVTLPKRKRRTEGSGSHDRTALRIV